MGADGRVVGVGQFGAAFCRRHAVFQALGKRGAHFAHQRQVFGQRLVGAFQHRHALLATQGLADQAAGEGAEHGQVDHAHLQLACGTQVVGHCFGLHHHAAHAQDHVVGVFGLPTGHAGVLAAGERGVFGHALFGQWRDGVKEVGPLRRHRLHVGVLVLHRARQQRHVHVPQRRHAAAFRAIQHGLRRCGGFDHVIGAAQELGHQFAFGQGG